MNVKNGQVLSALLSKKSTLLSERKRDPRRVSPPHLVSAEHPRGRESTQTCPPPSLKATDEHLCPGRSSPSGLPCLWLSLLVVAVLARPRPAAGRPCSFGVASAKRPFPPAVVLPRPVLCARSPHCRCLTSPTTFFFSSAHTATTKAFTTRSSLPVAASPTLAPTRSPSCASGL